jgi:hypothetical protein
MDAATYGFIVLRHVNSETTNKYWNQSVKLIRIFYPLVKIVIIDDNSNQNLVKADCEYTNLEIVESEYKGRGELLPLVYFYKYKWFENAVILHDSVFIHKRVSFELFNGDIQVLPLWHFNLDNECMTEAMQSIQYLKLSAQIADKLKPNVLGMPQSKCYGCFGVQCYINHAFLKKLINKYNLINLIRVIKSRKYRCGLERIMGVIFCMESMPIVNSLFGDIFKYSNSPHYKWAKCSYEDYENMLKNGKIVKPFIKVWTGR